MSPTSPPLFLLLFLIACPAPSAMARSLRPSVLLPCNVSAIPYPFGVPNHTDFRDGFAVTCNATISNGGVTPLLKLGGDDLPVINISLTDGYVRVSMAAITHSCSRGGNQTQPSSDLSLDGTPFFYSHTANKLTVLGCDALAILKSSSETSHTSGCASFCYSPDNLMDGECSGVGCCQAAIPKGLQSFNLTFNSIRNLTAGTNNTSYCAKGYRDHYNKPNGTIGYNNLDPCAMDYSSCSRAYILAQDNFVFSRDDIYERVPGDDKREVVLEWSIGNTTCEEARKNTSSYACQDNSDCYKSPTGVGYRCNCSQGYSGNPYDPHGGCHDIDECKESEPCVWRCKNTIGDFYCRCPWGNKGNGLKDGSFRYRGNQTNGTGCKRIQPLDIGLSVGLVSLVLVVAGTLCAYYELKKRKARTIKQNFFMRNGGLLLQQQISSHQAAARIFSVKELGLATNGFSADRIIGQGGYGTVYKGTLMDQRVVAIKKSKLVDENQIEQFVNEVVILSQINHRNVVKLLGFCLESQVPMLVYEYISNGTLSRHLHEEDTKLSWRRRLQIAAESATALAYLHTASSVPIIHRDIKSANILLDEDYTAKVSDFGVSRLVPYDQTHVTTLVQGTFGYLDPEYFHMGQLTEKSDVYSFGVVLVELLTGEKPVSFNRSDEQRNLASYFISKVKGKQIRDIIDTDTFKDAGVRFIYAVCDLARRCLNVKGEERPTMKEVAIELHALRKLYAMIQLDEQENEGQLQLLSSPLAPYNYHGAKDYEPQSYLLS